MSIYSFFSPPFFLKTFTLAFSLFLAYNAFPQLNEQDKDLSPAKLKARASYAAKTGDIYTALFYYEEVSRQNPHDMDARFQLAEMYRLARNYEKAEEIYADVLEKAGASYPFALYYKGMMQKMNGKYEEARENLILFRKEVRNLGDKEFKKILNREIAGCDSGMAYKEFPDNIAITNPGKPINYPHTEFSPFLADSSTLLFGSLRLDSLAFYKTRNGKAEKMPSRQIYEAKYENGRWEEKGKFEPLNDPSLEMGNFVYSPVTERYYFSKCTRDNKGHVTCRIYFTEKTKGKWHKPELLPAPVNLEGYTSTQPAVMTDTARRSEYLYFVSDRPGGKGGLDIWYTSYNSRRKLWTDPKNFGIANTSETECTPYFHIPSQTFYFSSDGHYSAGGLDILKLFKDEKGRYQRPQNLAFPINSSQDDLDFTLSEDGKKGFVVSNRPGGTPYFHETCCDDIFAFEILPPKPFNCTLDLAVSGMDTSGCTGQLLQVHSYDLKTKKEEYDTIRLEDCRFSLAMKENHQYSFKIDKEGYQHDSLTVVTRGMASNDILHKTLILKPEGVEKAEILPEKPVEDKPFVLKDIQYETNKSDLNDEAKAALDSILIPFLKLHPEDRVVISSHTDNVGSKKYNQHLSQQRADNVVKYLISKGIDAHRLHAKGYGESKPIAPNENPDGTPNHIGQSMNRRTEFLLHKP